ncbi:SUMF1/EgtB/PvdO family nonheme iron enzyme, partial [bacterium]|nr:SUMF1/EgtB/PvdO family nonheme iron enzyme [bacterium]
KARVKTLAAAKASMEQHDYAGVLSLIEKLKPEKIDEQLSELQSLAETREARAQELRTQVQQAANAHQHDGLLALVEEYLTLKPDDAQALKSRDQLRVAAKKLAAKQRVRRLQITLGTLTAAAFVLMLAVMFNRRAQGIARAISKALDRGDYAAALELDPGNGQARMLQQNAEDLATALRSRDYRRALQVDPSNVEALSMKKAADIQQALSDGDYAAVLEVDPSNAEALSMKKAAGLQQALSDGDYAAALQIDPTNAEALLMKKAAADVQQALSDGDYAAALRLDPLGAAKAMLSLSPIENSIGMELKLLPAGVFQMGEKNGRHEVTLTKPFMLGVHEVTQSQYEQVMGNNPSYSKGANNPVERVSWEDAVEFCRKLNALPAEKAAGNVYRLPTETEWEYACRAGTTTKCSFGDDDSELHQYAWFRENSGRKAHAVGSKQPNAWGLYDMYGNVEEWCLDWYGDYPSGPVTDPTGAERGSDRVFRGGCWSGTAGLCRSAYRSRDLPSFRSSYFGFRVCLIPSGQ